MVKSVYDRPIEETPIAIIDFETTGLFAGSDRVVEVSVVRIEPNKEPQLTFDTLVNPQRRVSATEIHGITDNEVVDAPIFRDIAGELLAQMNGCVIAAYNAYFDMKFLDFEMQNVGVDHAPPYFCLMYMRPLLDIGSRCKLEEACRLHNINYQGAHVAANDALAAGQLFKTYFAQMKRLNIRTFGDLAKLRSYKFLKSFNCTPYPEPSVYGLSECKSLCSRIGYVRKTSISPERHALGEYWNTLKTVLADLEITDEELQYVTAECQRLEIPRERIRALHAKAFASVLMQFCADEFLDDREARKLQRLHKCLTQLGWAPGD